MKKLLVFILLALFFTPASFAYFGARPMGMGGAFTAVADDANAPYWNPAGLALNPEVSITGSTLLNNRNARVGDNVANIKMCYEAAMSPFEWIAGVGIASVLALQSAQYLSDQGVVQKNWGRGGEPPSRDQAVTPQVTGTQEIASLKKELKGVLKNLSNKAAQTSSDIIKHTDVTIAVIPYHSPWYSPNYSQPNYWERPEPEESTKAQFALGLSWLNDNNPPLDQKSNWYTLTLASGFAQRIAVGAGINFYDLTKISTDIRGMGADLDLGVIAKPVEYISVGLTAKGILTTDFHWQDGQTTRGYGMQVNGGIAIKPIAPLTVAADVHNLLNQGGNQSTMHYGAEAVIIPGVLVRGGLYDGSKTAGMSLALANLILDYSYLGGSFSRTQMVGATWRF